ncbi:hypothetical protein AQ965_09785 [Burkholderia pseudomallei]|nr:hypothetical protein BOC51_23445 [Burkholderia pseudomallei]AYX39792.1 hypothetical protein EGY15_34195 [Burkholderia pseudomallei]OMR25746.1 hypothetical protein AQ720_06525 [Burkholderia pseudomallei]OMS17520.1 hypothetical protein AQ737_09805 [Burkholderia pseudomallei]OMT61417.1 hypothetical protein AQ759_17505 [Burkholderia pseudomallei]
MYEPHLARNGGVVIKGNGRVGPRSTRRRAGSEPRATDTHADASVRAGGTGRAPERRKHALPNGYKRAAFFRRARRRAGADQFGTAPAIAARMSP